MITLGLEAAAKNLQASGTRREEYSRVASNTHEVHKPASGALRKKEVKFHLLSLSLPSVSSRKLCATSTLKRVCQSRQKRAQGSTCSA